MQAGFQTEDLLLSVNGTKIDTPEIFINAAQDANGQPLTVVVERAGNSHTLTLTPLLPDNAIEGRIIGVDLDHNSTNPRLSRTPSEATREVFYYLDTMFRTTLTAPAKLMRQEMSTQEARMSSAVGVSQIAGRATAFSFKTSNIYPFLLTFAIINAALGFTQLLPVPALDGGRILFVLVEIIRRKRISPELETKIHRAGMWALLTLMVFLIVYDLFNPITQLLDQ
jgi:regulator of sigma E protease